MAGIAATGGVRPPIDGASKRAGSRYVLGDLLGRGGMAEVFAGYSVGDHGFQKPVAIKRLLPELANDDVFVDRLIEEAKLLVGMQHGHIVSVLDLAREGDDVFLVMEFVDGPTLRQLIKARGSRGLALGVATYIIQSAAAGLEFAHARPGGAIIHADISPSNLLLTTSGEVRVADFGIARREGLGQGVVEGKWAYMAPEQARGESLTPRSDVFALGVVMYELLTGQHPFGRAVTADQRDDQMRVIPPRVVKPTVPHGLDTICMRALAHDPRDRYGRMQALIDALVEERFANGYREGAADLAQAIREVAPRSDTGAPRTMHTERPVTIVTRSLLRDVTPVPSVPQGTPAVPVAHAAPMAQVAPMAHVAPMAQVAPRRPSYPLGPLDPPPPDEFPMQPTVAPTSARALDMPSAQFPAVPTEGVETLLHLPPEFLPVPPSGAQTVARVVDQAAQAAFAEADAAAAAAALLQIPSMMHSDGSPMPPFRLAHPVLPGGELASVVGGHTLTGHGVAAAVAVDNRNHRGTILVFAAAALIGVGAAIAIQLARNDSAAPPEPARLQAPPSKDSESAPRFSDKLVDDPAPAASPAAPAPPAVQPTFPDDPAPRDLSAPAAAPSAPASDPASAPTGEPASPSTGEPASPSTGEPAAPAPGASTIQSTAAPAVTTTVPADPPREGQPAPAEPEVASSTSTSSSSPRRAAREARQAREAREARDATLARERRKVEPGILVVQADPWAYVTVGNQQKETPDKFYLAPGTYTVEFYDAETDTTKSRRVTIESGKLQRITQNMRR